MQQIQYLNVIKTNKIDHHKKKNSSGRTTNKCILKSINGQKSRYMIFMRHLKENKTERLKDSWDKAP